LTLFDGFPEGIIEEQVGKIGISVVGGGDITQHAGPDDAACPPDLCNLAELKIVSVFARSHLQHAHPLGIGNNLACIERFLSGLDQFCSVAGVLEAWSGDDAAGCHALGFKTGKNTTFTQRR